METRRVARIRCLLALLIIGAVVNVAVAWVICIHAAASKWRHIDNISMKPDEVPPHLLELLGPRRQQHLQTASETVAHRPGLSMHDVFVTLDAAMDAEKAGTPATGRSAHVTASMSLTTLSAGWPCRSLQCWIEDDLTFNPGKARTRWGLPIRWGAPWDLAILDFPVLPLCPVPVGFVVNAVVYASALWCLALLPRALRRLFRPRTGCRVCGYDLAGLRTSICPECGNTPAG